MPTKTIKVVRFGTEIAVEKEVDIYEKCAFCDVEAIAAINFPEPYKVQSDETLELYGDVCFVEGIYWALVEDNSKKPAFKDVYKSGNKIELCTGTRFSLRLISNVVLADLFELSTNELRGATK